jgi:thiosulfate reductase/polysulfide reductase chain A
VSTQNNLYLNELVAENPLWMNKAAADKLGIYHNQSIVVRSDQYEGEMRAKVTEFIRPECVFMLHGFGHQVPFASRSYNKGQSDAAFMKNVSDRIGGSPALHDTFVQVRPLR